MSDETMTLEQAFEMFKAQFGEGQIEALPAEFVARAAFFVGVAAVVDFHKRAGEAGVKAAEDVAVAYLAGQQSLVTAAKVLGMAP